MMEACSAASKLMTIIKGASGKDPESDCQTRLHSKSERNEGARFHGNGRKGLGGQRWGYLAGTGGDDGGRLGCGEDWKVSVLSAQINVRRSPMRLSFTASRTA